MNPGLPKNPREEMELRLTALLLGELSADEAAAVREAMAKDPELVRLHDQLKETIQLVREAAVSVNEPTVGQKLSTERREKLLAHFKTVRPKEFAPGKKQRKFALVELAAVVAIVALLAAIGLPTLSKTKGRASRNFLSGPVSEDVLETARAQFTEQQALPAQSASGTMITPPPVQIVLPATVNAGLIAADLPASESMGDTLSLGGQGGGGAGGEILPAAVRPRISGKMDAFDAGALNAGVESIKVPQAGALIVAGKDETIAETETASVKQGMFRFITPPPSSPASTTFGGAAVNGRGETTLALSDVDRGKGSSDESYFGSRFISDGKRIFPEPEVRRVALATNWIPLRPEAGSSSAETSREPQLTTTGISTPRHQAQELNGKIQKAEEQLAQLRKNLVSDIDAQGTSPAPSMEADTLRKYVQTRTEAESRYAAKAKLLQQLKAMDRDELKKVLPTSLPDSELNELNSQLDLAEQKLAAAKKDYAPQSPEVVLAETQVEQLKEKTDKRIAGAMDRIELEVAMSKAQVENLTTTLESAKNVDREKADKARPYYEKKRELDSLQRLSQILKYKIESEQLDVNLPKTSMVEITDRATPPPPPKQTLWAKITGNDEAQAVAKIKVEGNVSDISQMGPAKESPAFDPHFVRTERELIESEIILSKVVTLLKLDQVWADKHGGQLTRSDAVSLLKRKLEVEPVRNTKLLEIRAKDESPEEAAKLANAVAEAYRNHRMEELRQRTVGGIKVLEERYQEQEQKVRKAQQELALLNSEIEKEQSDLPIRKPATNAPIPQPEIQTSENAFSTFSLNVSDVSFKLAAASLEKGQMPDVASVRSEEFINAFDYRDPEPKGGAPIAFAWERVRYPFSHNRDLLRFSLKTAAAGRQAGRPMNIVLLLDNSGSMERADRVRIIREALRVLASQLQAQDRLSVITFARTARLVADGISGDKAGEVTGQVSGLTPEGGTNLEDAMNLAYQTAAKHYLANGINRVVLLTDGAANLGDVEPESLKQKVEKNRKQGIALDCFGIGWEGFNDDLLEVLSRNGDGRYGFINSPEEASTEFAGQLAGALKVAASDVKVQVEFNPKRTTNYRQIGYAKHQLTKEQFRDNTLDAAEIAAQEAGNALYTVEVNPNGQGPLCTVRVRYKIPGTSDYREQSWDVPYAGNALPLEQSSPAMRLAASASAFSEWLVASPFAAEVKPDALLGYLRGVPDIYGADTRPKKLEWMIRQAKSIARE